MNVTKVITKDYKKRILGGVRKTKPNKANSKPIKANLPDAQNERKPSFNKGLRKMSKWVTYENKANSNPTCSELVEPISEPKKCGSSSLSCGISKEKMIFCNCVNTRYHLERS